MTTFMIFDENRTKHYEIEYSVNGKFFGWYSLWATNSGEAIKEFYKDEKPKAKRHELIYDEKYKVRAERICQVIEGRKYVVAVFGENYDKCSFVHEWPKYK